MPARTMTQRLAGNFRKIQFINFFHMFLVILPVVVPYWQSHGLDMQQIYLLQTFFSLSLVILEVPSGYLCDHFGRKRTLLLAGLFSGFAFTWFVGANSFVDFLVYELLAAIGVSLFSGTDVALIYDTAEAIDAEAASSGVGGRGVRSEASAGAVRSEADVEGVRSEASATSVNAGFGDEVGAKPGVGTVRPGSGYSRAASVLGRKVFASQVGETVASLVGGTVAAISLALPARVNAVTAWIPFLIALTLVEPPRKREVARSHRERFSHLTSLLFKESRFLRLVLLNLIAYGLATLLAVWAFQGHWHEKDIPIAVFGYLWAAYNLIVALTARVAHDLERRFGATAVLVTIGVLPVLGYFGMAYAGAIAGVLFGLSFQVSRGLNQVVLRDQLNVRVPTAYRATANSIASLGVRLGFALAGPFLGGAIDEQGYRGAFLVFGGLFAIAFVGLCVPLIRAWPRVKGETRVTPGAGVN